MPIYNRLLGKTGCVSVWVASSPNFWNSPNVPNSLNFPKSPNFPFLLRSLGSTVVPFVGCVGPMGVFTIRNGPFVLCCSCVGRVLGLCQAVFSGYAVAMLGCCWIC